MADEDNNPSSNSLCFKLKVSKQVKDEPVLDDGSAQPQQEEDEDDLLPFACPVCEKRFKSGKALGGHKRMHNIKTKKEDDEEEEEDDQEDDQEVVSCPECNKPFRSKKSLFGHMRSHPERSWRGIQPPSNRNSSPPPMSWSVTGKRNRKSTMSTTSASSSSSVSMKTLPPGMDNDFKQTVLHLMLLAHYKPKPKANKKKQEERDLGLESKLMKKKKKKRYECSACHKWFDSYQALGGHRSSHNKSNVSSHKIPLDFDLNHPPPDPQSPL